jgi:ferredoxin-NADP reductase
MISDRLLKLQKQRSRWNIATLIKKEMVADDVMSLKFDLGRPVSFQAGQHVDIRLTAPDGYQAERSYSLANAPEENNYLELGVQLLPDGEVSPYLFQMKEGKEIEMTEPIGTHFVWNTSLSGPLILLGGGSGMVPLMSMVRHYVNSLTNTSSVNPENKTRDIVFLISARSLEHVLYKKELTEISQKFPNIKIIETLTDTHPENWTGYARRIDQAMLQETIAYILPQNPRTFICGPNPFVAAVAKHMIHIGFDPTTIKTERFGG